MNIALRIEKQAKIRPSEIAIKFPKKLSRDSYLYETRTFKELNDISSNFAAQFEKLGITKGVKTLLFVRPSLDFPCLVFALFKLGAIPILIDPGMGRKNLLNSIEQVAPEAIIAESEVFFLSLIFSKSFKSIKTKISVGRKFFKSIHTLKEIKSKTKLDFKTFEATLEDTAAILFTSGGTGRPKGVVYTHEIFNTQTDMLQEMFGLTNKDVDLPGFPLFSFFTMSMGMTSCIPDMNPSKPAKCNPEALVQNINDNNATFIAGSPAIWERVADYCLSNNLILPSVKYLVMFGAPVRVDLHKKLSKVLTSGTTYTPYGATEALPVSNISGRYILENTAKLSDNGKGTCIGPACPQVEIKIIKVSDEVISKTTDMIELPAMSPGEIIVKAKIATKEYFQMEDKTKEAKIYEEDGSFWHRMGDIGYLDEEGKLWFLGRKVHRVELSNEVKYPISCEAIFNNHILVKKSALIKLTKNKTEKAAIVIEPTQQYINKTKMLEELKSLAKKHDHTKNIEDFFFTKAFPVDVRHNIKIDRKKLQNFVNEGKIK